MKNQMCHTDYINTLVYIDFDTSPNQNTTETLIIVQACQEDNPTWKVRGKQLF